MMSSCNSSPCAACKIQRRKCTKECIFAPYFPPENPQKFTYVHKVFGASNVAKLLNEVDASQREDAVKSLAYEAEARLRDPVYGCVGLISHLQNKLKNLQNELNVAKKELATYVGPQIMLPTPMTAASSSYFSVTTSSVHQQRQEFFTFNAENSFSNNFQMNPFQNQLMVSSSSSSSQAQSSQPIDAFLSKKVFKAERDNLGEGMITVSSILLIFHFCPFLFVTFVNYSIRFLGL